MPPHAPPPDASGAAATAAALRSNWRKVASTDNLQAFAEAADPTGDADARQPGASAGSRLTGLCMLVLAAMLAVAQLLVLAAKATSLSSQPKHTLLRALANDRYYVYLGPLLLPMLLIAVTINWFSLKLFKHNS